MIKDTCLDSSLTAAQSLVLQDLEGYRRSQRLTNSDQIQKVQTINKTVHQKVPKYQTNGTKRFYSLLRTREHKNHLNQSNG
jgi:hypothetical protein